MYIFYYDFKMEMNGGLELVIFNIRMVLLDDCLNCVLEYLKYRQQDEFKCCQYDCFVKKVLYLGLLYQVKIC